MQERWWGTAINRHPGKEKASASSEVCPHLSEEPESDKTLSDIKHSRCYFPEESDGPKNMKEHESIKLDEKHSYMS